MNERRSFVSGCNVLLDGIRSVQDCEKRRGWETVGVQ